VIRIHLGNAIIMSVASKNAARFIPTRRSLLSRLRDWDDQSAWRDFFETYWKLIYRAARQAGLSDVEAQDVVQETILTVSRKIQTFRYDPAAGSFKGWLLQTTRWRVLDQLRKRGPDSPHGNGAPLSQDILSDLSDPASARLDAVWEAEWRQNLIDAAIRRVKGRVQPKHYQVFELCHLKGWAPGRVAKALGVTRAQTYLARHRVSRMVQRELARLEASGV